MNESTDNKPYRISERQASMVEFELRDGTSKSLAYINLREIHFESLGKGNQNQAMILYFDQASVEISGENLEDIKNFLKSNILDFIRIGISVDPNEPQIRSIRHIPSKQFTEKN